MNGFVRSVNEMGFTAVRLHYTADPNKSPEWVERVRKLYPDPNRWAAEMEISFWAAQGARVFPQFLEHKHCDALLARVRQRKLLVRAWDFGWHAPAVLIGQIDPQDRLLVVKEIIGHQETTREFASKVIERCAQWFPVNAGWTDICDPAGQHVSASASERNEARDVEILNKLGVWPRWEWGWSRKDGRSLIHQLLGERTDGTPSMLVDPSGCPTLTQGFLGKYVYPPRKGGQVADEPDENEHPWADAMAALRYMVTGLYSSLGLRRPTHGEQPVQREVDYHGYGTPKRRAA